MNFASLQFAIFLSLLFGAYVLLRRHEQQNWLLLLSSYYFYACWDPRFLLLILAITGASFGAGRLVAGSDNPARRKLWLVAYAVFSLAVLGIFKYLDFFLESAQTGLTSLGLRVNPLHLGILLPAAISFFTFESLSYVIDIYRRQLPGTVRLKHYALFIGYFPKLVAGPIERPEVLIPQIQQPRRVNERSITRGLFLILLGLFKKIVVADGLAPTVSSVFDSGATPSALDITLGTYAFALQIYCDFSGYTDVARGVSKLFGIELSQNFRFPYFSANASEFWRRWHISLSSWLRDYLYIPLGGNRLGELRTRANLMITMLLGGLWHGAAWNFVLWGAYQGGLLAVQRALPSFKPPRGATAFVRVLTTLFFFHLVCYGWLLFRAQSFAQIDSFTAELIHGSFNVNTSLHKPPIAAMLGAVTLIAYDFVAYRTGRATFYRSLPVPLRSGLYATLIFLTIMGLVSERSAFIYFQF